MKVSGISRWIAVAAVAYLAAGISLFGAQAGTVSQRQYVGGRYALILDGNGVGQIFALEGGEGRADVVSEPMGPDRAIRKHIGNVRYDDISVKLGWGMDKAIYDWITASWAQNYARKNGAISVLNIDNKESSRVEFFNALITETSFPACDAANKEPSYIELTFAPEYTRQLKGTGQTPAAALSAPPVGKVRPLPGLRPGGARPGVGAAPAAAPASVSAAGVGKEAKAWLPSNFRLTIGGLDCSRVSKIDSFAVKQKVTSSPLGELRDVAKEPTQLEIPNLAITMSEVASQTWFDWFEDFVIKGNCGQDKERTGTLEFLDATRQTTLFTITFKGLGIFKFSSTPIEPRSEQVRKKKAELYCESMEFKLGPPK